MRPCGLNLTFFSIQLYFLLFCDRHENNAMKGGDGVRPAGVIMYDDTVVVDIHLISRSKEVFAMTRPGDKSKKMKLKLRTDTGDFDKPVKDNQGRKATELSPEESEQIYNDKSTQHKGEILYRHESPG